MQPEFLKTLNARIAKSHLAQRILAGTAWSLAGAIGGRVFTLLASVIVARTLGKEGFGEFGMIQNTIVSFSIFAGLGLGLSATKHTAEFRTTDPLRAGRIIRLSQQIALFTGAATMLFVFCFADLLAAHAMAAPALAPQIRISCGILLIGALLGVQDGALNGLEAFRTIAQLTFVGGIIGCLLTVVGVVSSGLTGACAAVVIGAAILWLLKRNALRSALIQSGIPSRPTHSGQEWNAVWRFSLPAIVSSLFVVPVNWACNLILVNQAGGYAEMGVLNAAIQWRNIVLFVPSALISVALPMMTSLGSGGELRKQRNVLLMNVALAASVAIVVASAVSLFSSPIMASYGAGFHMGKSVLILQAFAAAIAAVVGVIGQYLISCSAMWSLIGLQIIWAIINISLTWAFSSQGAHGVSLAYLLAYIVHMITMSCFTVYKIRKTRI